MPGLLAVESAFWPYEKRWCSVPTSSASSGRPSICICQSARSPISTTRRWVVRRARWIKGGPRLPACGGRRPRERPGVRSRADRVHGPQRRLLLLRIDAELGTGLLGDHRQRQSRRSRAWSSRPRARVATSAVRCPRSTHPGARRPARSGRWRWSRRDPHDLRDGRSTSAARSATSSDWTRSSTSAEAASRRAPPWRGVSSSI